ncbi:hypothetical protein PGT21_027876 [Puccinia graminis f. sp. tritici]|uniref:Uncharacterized protein n=1 Tax=Puccinia graminis f. sp. tritici TaxID=56615 RepID=A0A5B0Q6K6_PUCGR|nr:hypothetical protein PGT21_027876 [Puccinia graminis f. sp. tritici]
MPPGTNCGDINLDRHCTHKAGLTWVTHDCNQTGEGFDLTGNQQGGGFDRTYQFNPACSDPKRPELLSAGFKKQAGSIRTQPCN